MNRPGELEHLAYLLGRDRRDVRGLLQAAALDGDMRSDATLFLRGKVQAEGGDPDDPGALPIVRELPPGTVRVGPVWNGRAPGPVFSIPRGDRHDMQHVAVLGSTRRGKSFLLRHIARQCMLADETCWIFDTEDEYQVLVAEVTGPAAPVVLSAHDLRFNLFEPPADSVSTRTWLGDVCGLLREQVYLRDGSLNRFYSDMLRLIGAKGTRSGSRQYPCLAETLQHFTNLRLGASKARTSTWIESLVNRLQLIADAFPAAARITSSDFLPRLGERSAILRLRGLRDVPLVFLVSYLLTWLVRFKEGQDQ